MTHVIGNLSKCKVGITIVLISLRIIYTRFLSLIFSAQVFDHDYEMPSVPTARFFNFGSKSCSVAVCTAWSNQFICVSILTWSCLILVPVW